ncbi:YvrJ family protein [Kurthia sibirica]|uniref:YvrJ family protein n=1 Tax=Kurthia sibirica TaxID=202750 RepID=A0A2U3ALH1_9BACL|nr:YvrJ family protein [Kurthia sibirica]PWI25374.1 YvrJ family protein [Kurthia sibirica]GEK34609.1 YvrJ family protein [Kurthia sibirica]
MEEWFAFIQNIGFPIVVAFYLLHRVETKLQGIEDVLIQLLKTSSQIRQ